MMVTWFSVFISFLGWTTPTDMCVKWHVEWIPVTSAAMMLPWTWHWSCAQNSHWILPMQSVTSLSWLLRCLFLVFNSPFLVLHFSCLLVNSLIYGDDSSQSVAVNHSVFGEIQLSRQEESPHGYHLPMIDESRKVTSLLIKT